MNFLIWTTGRLILFFQPPFLFLFFCYINSIATLGYIDLQIGQLILKKTPPGCCIVEANCSRSHNYCLMDFRFCVGIAEFPFNRQHNKECQILSANFTLSLQGNLALDGNNRTSIVFDSFPAKRYNVTSAAIQQYQQNIFIELGIWSGSNPEKSLLFTRNYVPSFDIIRERPRAVDYNVHGNILTYQISASCLPGFIGESCTLLCKPPLINDNYICTSTGMQCIPGWNGTRCDQPICLKPCANGGRCISPDQCACPNGWDGPQCTQCKPKVGCQNGYCIDNPGKCFCLPNWTGSNCNLKINKCLEKPCKNGGRCTTYGIHGDFFRCLCLAGFTGIDCSFSYTDCTNAECGSNARCKPQKNGGYICVCAQGYTGADCNEEDRTENNDIILYNDEHLEQQFLISNNTTKTIYQWAGEIGTVNALLLACFCLLLLILSILCCGWYGTFSSYTNVTACCVCPPLSFQQGVKLSSLNMDKMKKGKVNLKTNQQSTIFIKPRTFTNNWCTNNSAATKNFTSDDKVDPEYRVCSVHSCISQPCNNAESNIDDNVYDVQQQQARLMYCHPSTRLVLPAAPPPSYEESIIVNRTHEQIFI